MQRERVTAIFYSFLESRLIVSTLIGVLYFLIAMCSDQRDWYISDFHAQLIHFGKFYNEIPFFSFIWNRGSYFIQDPQSIIFTPSAVLIHYLGPTFGLRIGAGLTAAVGSYFFIRWLEKRISLRSSIVAVLGWTLSCGFFWRISTGNDMFVWNLMVPACLFYLEALFEKPNFKSSMALGTILGVMILAPTFHTATYLLLPVVIIYFPLLAIRETIRKPGWRKVARIVSFGLLALSIQCAVGLPRIATFKVFQADLKRESCCWPQSTVSFQSGLRALFNFSETDIVTMTADPPDPYNWNTEEWSVALNPLISLFAILGLVFVLANPKWRRDPIVLLAFLLLFFGMLITTHFPFWTWLAYQSPTYRFRVSSRFFGLAAFGLAIFSGYGFQILVNRVRKFGNFLFVSTCGLSILFTLLWVDKASVEPFFFKRSKDSRAAIGVNPKNPTPNFISFFSQTWNKGISQINLPKSLITEIRTLPLRATILESGLGYYNSIEMLGSKAPVVNDKIDSMPIVLGQGYSDYVISNTTVLINGAEEKLEATVNSVLPAYGYSTTTVPPNLSVEIEAGPSWFKIKNTSGKRIDQIRIQALWPIPRLIFLLWGVAIAGISVFFISGFFRRNRQVNPNLHAQ